MRKIQMIWFVVFLMLASCGDNIQREKDMYPEIPNFPEFKGGKLKSKKIADIRLRLNEKFKRQYNQYYFNYLVKDSSLYIMTYFSDTEFPKIELYEDYIVDMLIVSNKGYVKHLRWKMDDFDINLAVDTDRNVTIGTHKYLIKTNFSTFDTVPASRNESSAVPATFKTWESRKLEKIEDTDYFSAFNSATVGSHGSVTGSFDRGGWGYAYAPVDLVYYKLTYKNKIYRTKIDYSNENAPLMVKLGQEIYYVNYHEEDVADSTRVKQYSVYKIEDNLHQK